MSWTKRSLGNTTGNQTRQNTKSATTISSSTESLRRARSLRPSTRQATWLPGRATTYVTVDEVVEQVPQESHLLAKPVGQVNIWRAPNLQLQDRSRKNLFTTNLFRSALQEECLDTALPWKAQPGDLNCLGKAHRSRRTTGSQGGNWCWSA